MFSSRLKRSDKIFDRILVYDVSKSDERATLDWCYPSDGANQDLLAKLPDFILPCQHRSSVSEQYVLLFTDLQGKFDFIVCLLLPLSGYAVCIKSVHPWFELFHSILTLISQDQLYSAANRAKLIGMVKHLTQKDGLFYFDVSSSDRLVKISSPVPDARGHPFYHRYILEYYNSLSISNWIFIFEVMLLEKSVIFYSSRIHRVTACILASLSLLYPLTWVHLIYPLLPASCIDYVGCPTPFIAGIHSCMLENVKKLVSPGVLLVDLDLNKLYSVGEVDAKLPDVLRHWLINRCKRNPPDFAHHGTQVKFVPGRAAATMVQPYLEIMTVLLGGYRLALVYNDSHDGGSEKSSVSHSTPCLPHNCSLRPSALVQKWTFDRDIFIESRGSMCQAYLRSLLQSQMVVEFMESRLAILNSNVGMIPQDDFEDLLSHIPYTSRSQMSQIVVKGREKLDRLIKKLSKRKMVSLTKAKQLGTKLKGAFSSTFAPEDGNFSKSVDIPTSPRLQAVDDLLLAPVDEETDTSDSGDDSDSVDSDLVSWDVRPHSEPLHQTREGTMPRRRDSSLTTPTAKLVPPLEHPTVWNNDDFPDLLSFTDGSDDLLEEVFSRPTVGSVKYTNNRVPIIQSPPVEDGRGSANLLNRTKASNDPFNVPIQVPQRNNREAWVKIDRRNLPG